ncbi:MAG: acetolactate synthase small subunit [Eubacteriales bacterium]|nr:acetolactate synthase small subunit [Eubacteriales bacterium]
MLQSLSILVENRAGVLTRVTNLFARRGFNIESLAVGTTQNPAISRISITLLGDLRLVDQITKQLHKLPDVLIVRHLNPDDHFSRELIFVKVRCTAESRGEIMDIVDIFRGHVIDVSPRTMTIEMTGNESKIRAMQELLDPYGVLELVRTGTISIERGEQFMNVEIQS